MRIKALQKRHLDKRLSKSDRKMRNKKKRVPGLRSEKCKFLLQNLIKKPNFESGKGSPHEAIPARV